jgi:hyperosmotically inducible periplasmic protein
MSMKKSGTACLMLLMLVSALFSACAVTRRADEDTKLGSQVMDELQKHKDVSTIKPEVSVQDGIVTLRGQAENQAQKELAGEYAKDVKGVKGVINQMTVAGAGNAPQTLGQEMDDAVITAQVKLALLTHRATSALNTQVETRGGVVTVHGAASSQAEKDLVTKLITDIDGVRGVNNRMVVQYGGKSS